MTISEKIKEQRLKNNWTQEDLAQLLNVSRPAVSSWEVGRNYPDLETIIAMSDIFDISLDELLKGDKKVVEKISEDTTVRKIQSKKIKSLIFLIVLLIIIGLVLGYKSIENVDISTSNQVKEVTILKNGDMVVDTSIPFYRSMSSYMSTRDDSSKTIEVVIGYSFDWSMKHNESILVSLDKEFIKDAKTVKFMNQKGDVLKTVSLD